VRLGVNWLRLDSISRDLSYYGSSSMIYTSNNRILHGRLYDKMRILNFNCSLDPEQFVILYIGTNIISSKNKHRWDSKCCTNHTKVFFWKEKKHCRSWFMSHVHYISSDTYLKMSGYLLLVRYWAVCRRCVLFSSNGSIPVIGYF